MKHWVVSFLEEELKKSMTALPKCVRFYFLSKKLLLKTLPVQFFYLQKVKFSLELQARKASFELTHHASVVVNIPFHQLSRARTVLVFPQDFDTQISKQQQKIFKDKIMTLKVKFIPQNCMLKVGYHLHCFNILIPASASPLSLIKLSNIAKFHYTRKK